MAMTPSEMREYANTLEKIAPHVDTPYGKGQVLTYGLCVEGLLWGADEIERLQGRLTRLLYACTLEDMRPSEGL